MSPSLSILGIWLMEARVSDFNSWWIRLVKTFCRFFCDVTKEWSAAQSAVTSCGCAVSLWWCSCGNLVGRSISSCCLNLPETRCSLAQLKRWNGQLGSSELASGICIFCDPCPILAVCRPALAGATWISNISFLSQPFLLAAQIFFLRSEIIINKKFRSKWNICKFITNRNSALTFNKFWLAVRSQILQKTAKYFAWWR